MTAISTYVRRLALPKAVATQASLFARTASRSLSTQKFVHGSSDHSHFSAYLWAMTATAAATAGLAVNTAQGVVKCEREGAVRDPKTCYGMNTDNMIQVDLKRELAQQLGTASLPAFVSEPVKGDTVLPPKSPARPKEELMVISATSPKENIAPASPDDPMAEPSTHMTPQEALLEAATLKAKKHGGGLKLFSGNGNMGLSLEIAKLLGVNLGRATVSSFADGEINVRIHENVRGKDVYIIQPTCPPVNNNLMELLLMVSCLNRASARRVTVVIPYYGYARQDRKMQARVPISAADVARLLESMGVDRVIAVDLHCGQIQGFFGPRVPVDNLDGGVVGIDHFGGKDLHNPVIVSPDAGGVYRAKKFKEGLAYKYGWEDVGIAMIIKQRARAGTVDQMDLVGDVKDCDCIIVDDMIDTAGTLCKAADVLVAKGARRVFAFASHGLLSGPGNERIGKSKLEECVILNTIPSSPQRSMNDKLVELSVAPLLSQTIFNIHAKRSISALFK